MTGVQKMSFIRGEQLGKLIQLFKGLVKGHSLYTDGYEVGINGTTFTNIELPSSPLTGDVILVKPIGSIDSVQAAAGVYVGNLKNSEAQTKIYYNTGAAVEHPSPLSVLRLKLGYDGVRQVRVYLRHNF